MNNKKFLIIIIIILIYVGLKLFVLHTATPDDDHLPDTLLELISSTIRITP